jgi:hypothetical protein
LSEIPNTMDEAIDTTQPPAPTGKRFPQEMLIAASQFGVGYRVTAAGLLSGVFTHESMRKNYPADVQDENDFGNGVLEALADWEVHHEI